MSFFDARIHLPGQTRLPVNVVVDISDDRIKLLKGEIPLGDWSLDEVGIDIRPDAIYLKVDQEEIALTVADSERFADAIRTRARSGANISSGIDSPPDTSAMADHPPYGEGLAGRLRGIDPETHFEEVRQHIDELAKDLANESVSPSEAFGRWLRLLKEINVRHGQGAMPTPLFYRLNTQLLDLIPPPKKNPNPRLQGVGPRPRS